jgi:hypothetical protein
LTCVCTCGLLFWLPLHLSVTDVAAMTGDTLTLIQAAVHISRPMIAYVLLYVHLVSFFSTNCSFLPLDSLPVEVVLVTRRLFNRESLAGPDGGNFTLGVSLSHSVCILVRSAAICCPHYPLSTMVTFYPIPRMLWAHRVSCRASCACPTCRTA